MHQWKRTVLLVSFCGLWLACGLRVQAVVKLQPYQQAFIQKMVSAAHHVNHDLRLDRSRVLALQAKHEWTSGDIAWLRALSAHYGVYMPKKPTAAMWQALLLRVNTIPASMTIAQSIDESNWGRSHFAVKANNYFGIWCFKEGCGLVPSHPHPGRYYAIKTFPSMTASVAYYMYNLNTNQHYEKLRAVRAEYSRKGKVVSGLDLADTLLDYSERGRAYINDIKRIIVHYQLQQYDT